MDKNELFQSLFNSFKKANSTKSAQDMQKKTVTVWNEIKHLENVSTKVASIITENESLALKQKGTMLQYWGSQLGLNNKAKIVPSKNRKNANTDTCSPQKKSVTASQSNSIEKTVLTILLDKYSKCTAQDDLKSKIELLNCDLIGLYKRKQAGQLTDIQIKTMKEIEIKKNKLEKDLKIKLADQKRQQKSRVMRKRKLNEFFEKNPEAKKDLKIRDTVGRPRVEIDQPGLLQTIINIAVHGSASHERRSEDIFRSIKTLSELTYALNNFGFHLSRTATYFRLLPKRSYSSEGKRHIQTVPVKLIRAQKDAHSSHIDAQFCKATINHLEEIASMLGPNEVCFISQDDKARVPIGLTAANTQAPMVMHVEYRVSLPDHDWVVAARHKLIPSVYAGIIISKNGNGDPSAVGYSGPTYIAIRSGKHSSSTPYTHALDFNDLLNTAEFDIITKFNNKIKPIVIFTVDGGPDENPRYQKVIDVGIHNFLKHHLHALFIVTNAPGRSAFNRVERRMAPLSKELSGLILPHEHFGTHLDSQGRTIDDGLEMQNFQFCGETLAEIWSHTCIDGFHTSAKYIVPENSEMDPIDILGRDQHWFAVHVKTSQYFTQIVKCQDAKCCGKHRSSLFDILGDGFLSPPIILQQTDDGLKCPLPTDTQEHCNKFTSIFAVKNLNLTKLLPISKQMLESMPYDLYCPSIQNEINERICNTCNIYFASKVMLKKHKVIHSKTSSSYSFIATLIDKKIRPVRIAARRQREMMAIIVSENNTEYAEWIDDEDIDLSDVEEVVEENIAMPVYKMDNHLSSAWTDN